VQKVQNRETPTLIFLQANLLNYSVTEANSLAWILVPPSHSTELVKSCLQNALPSSEWVDNPGVTWLESQRTVISIYPPVNSLANQQWNGKMGLAREVLSKIHHGGGMAHGRLNRPVLQQGLAGAPGPLPTSQGHSGTTIKSIATNSNKAREEYGEKPACLCLLDSIPEGHFPTL
jgi:hypothetical protein